MRRQDDDLTLYRPLALDVALASPPLGADESARLLRSPAEVEPRVGVRPAAEVEPRQAAEPAAFPRVPPPRSAAFARPRPRESLPCAGPRSLWPPRAQAQPSASSAPQSSGSRRSLGRPRASWNGS